MIRELRRTIDPGTQTFEEYGMILLICLLTAHPARLIQPKSSE
jgi:hypothetical protein